MSYYYKYNFVSPDGVFATVKEELKSYFDTGAVDDLMFPTYLNKALNKLGKSSYYIAEDILNIEDFKARLPDNFYSVREAWLCTPVQNIMKQNANSFYSQAASASTIQVSPVISDGEPCTNGECNDNCEGAECMPQLIQAVYKTTNAINISYRKKYLLKPGNVSVKKNCDLECANFGSSSVDSFDIRDNKLWTNFREGTVYLVFYATEYDNNDNQLIPDNFRVKEYIEHFIKYKIIEQLSNQINDETFAQLQTKLLYYKGLADEAYILADIELKKQTAWEKARAIKKQKNRLNMYELPGQNHPGTWRGWRANGDY